MNADRGKTAVLQDSSCEDYVVIVTIVESAFAETALKAAKATGVEGYTLVHARGKPVSTKESMFRMSLDFSRDLVLAVVHKDKAMAVQDSIFEAVGLNTQSHSLVYQLPVNALAGLVCGQEAAFAESGSPLGCYDKGGKG